MVALLSLIALFLAAGPVFAQDTIHVARASNAFAAEGGPAAVLERAYGRLGFEVVFHDFPAGEALQAAEEGRVDGELARVSGLPAGFDDLLRIDTPVSFMNLVVLARDDAFESPSWVELRESRLVLLSGIIAIEESVLAGRVEWTSDVETLVALLASGDADATVMDTNSARVMAATLGAPFRVFQLPLQTNLLYHYVHRSRSALVEPLGQVLREMLIEGETQEVLGIELGSWLIGGEG